MNDSINIKDLKNPIRKCGKDIEDISADLHMGNKNMTFA